jgi:hypothetical protein
MSRLIIAFAVIVQCILMFSGCASGHANKKFVWKSDPAQKRITNETYDIEIQPVCNSLGCKAFLLSLSNKTDNTIEINWDKTLYFANGRTSGGFVFESGVGPLKLTMEQMYSHDVARDDTDEPWKRSFPCEYWPYCYLDTSAAENTDTSKRGIQHKKPPDIVPVHSGLAKAIWPTVLVYQDRSQYGGWEHSPMQPGENGILLDIVFNGKELLEKLTVNLSVSEVRIDQETKKQAQ